MGRKLPRKATKSYLLERQQQTTARHYFLFPIDFTATRKRGGFYGSRFPLFFLLPRVQHPAAWAPPRLINRDNFFELIKV